jgi:molybdopterin synthase catalytic subunit
VSKTDSQRFLEAMKQIVSVPKAEIDRREAAWRKARKTKKESKAD